LIKAWSGKMINLLQHIYALVDPREPDNIRYIGRTSKNLGARLNAHCNDTKVDARTVWIKSLAKEGIRPQIIPIASVIWAHTKSAVEAECIQQFKRWGYQLLNVVSTFSIDKALEL